MSNCDFSWTLKSWKMTCMSLEPDPHRSDGWTAGRVSAKLLASAVVDLTSRIEYLRLSDHESVCLNYMYLPVWREASCASHRTLTPLWLGRLWTHKHTSTNSTMFLIITLSCCPMTDLNVHFCCHFIKILIEKMIHAVFGEWVFFHCSMMLVLISPFSITTWPVYTVPTLAL